MLFKPNRRYVIVVKRTKGGIPITVRVPDRLPLTSALTNDVSGVFRAYRFDRSALPPLSVKNFFKIDRFVRLNALENNEKLDGERFTKLIFRERGSISVCRKAANESGGEKQADLKLLFEARARIDKAGRGRRFGCDNGSASRNPACGGGERRVWQVFPINTDY